MIRIRGIKAVSFDGDGTLWDFEAVMRYSLGHVLQELARLEPQTAGQLSVDKMIEIRDEVARELRGKTTNLELMRLEAFRRTLKEVGKPDEGLAVHLNKIYLQHRFQDIELFPDAHITLTALGSRYVLGLVSNGNSYPHRCGLRKVLRFVVFSQEYGVEKPDIRLFRIALKAVGCTSRQMVHVGDSLDTDVLGANDAGLLSVWLNRKGQKNDTEIAPDYEIRSLTELLNIL